MNLNDYLKNQDLKSQAVTKEEIDSLFKIVTRDLKDANIPHLSSDRKFITAYNAALQIATIVLRAKGFRTNPHRSGHHRISIDSLPLIMGKEASSISKYLNACRLKRHACEYTGMGEASDSEAKELIREVEKFRSSVLNWLRKNHAELI